MNRRRFVEIQIQQLLQLGNDSRSKHFQKRWWYDIQRNILMIELAYIIFALQNESTLYWETSIIVYIIDIAASMGRKAIFIWPNVVNKIELH